ncbi:MAG TPA: ADP-ribosylglycohydrolase family protein [Bacteroidales bacterium]
MKYLFPSLLIILLLIGCNVKYKTISFPDTIKISKNELANKIKGGWAGQVIGCTYGGPTEFRFKGTMIQDYTPIKWDSTSIKWYYENDPGLYDDIYMDLTFVDVFEKLGLNATAIDHGKAFANAEYSLWHANQSARYNILNGIEPPLSGYWKNNPHADDIDFQIEADFAGLMSPGMVNSSAAICDKVGHIMNYGDGWYGGVYIAAMYSLAFNSHSPEFVVKEALKVIPERSTFYQCINDVIKWHDQYPNDWKQAWFNLQKKWSSDIGCPDGVFNDFDIDAKINAAYMVIGLLYGKGDFGKTIEIATRCGQDSDCNPASAGGILGAIIGYDSIPKYWKQGLSSVENINFKYTTMSLNSVYGTGLKHALEMIKLNGGKIDGDNVQIKFQIPQPVKFEQSFKDCYPVDFKKLNKDYPFSNSTTEYSIDFNGTSFVITGNIDKIDKTKEDIVQEIEVYLDGKLMEIAKLPTNYNIRKNDITWKYNLEKGIHNIRLKLKNSKEGYKINLWELLIYDNKPRQ